MDTDICIIRKGGTCMVNTLPAGVKSFECLRKDRYIYADQTEYPDSLIHTGGKNCSSRKRSRLNQRRFDSEKRMLKEWKAVCLH